MKEEEKKPLISCDVCRKEIPRSAAQTYEGEEYVMHFCGLDCYNQWKPTEEEEEKKTD